MELGRYMTVCCNISTNMWRICHNKHILVILLTSGILVNLLYMNKSRITEYEVKLNSEHAQTVNDGLDIDVQSAKTTKVDTLRDLTGLVFNKTRWFELRKELLSKNGPGKLFLFSYMRGGSSVAGELFNCDRSATMWYEPADAFFPSYYGLAHENLPQNDLYFKNLTRRVLDTEELTAMTNFYTNKFTCNYNELPPESMAHYFLGESSAMDPYMKCMRGKRTNGVSINGCNGHIRNICSDKMVEKSINAKCHIPIVKTRTIIRNFASRNESKFVNLLRQSLNSSEPSSHISSADLLKFVRHELCVQNMRMDNSKCIHTAIQKCKSDSVRVVQVNRMKMEDLEPLIQTNPDMHVIHYTRDPRGILSSRLYSMNRPHVFDKSNLTAVREAEFLCHRMREDLRQRKILEERYPGVIKHMTYESLTENPHDTAKVIYSLFNKLPPTAWNAFVSRNMNSKEGGASGISVKNVTETARKWTKKIPQSQQSRVHSLCSDVIIDLGYEL